jgi:hypothetical protein
VVFRPNVETLEGRQVPSGLGELPVQGRVTAAGSLIAAINQTDGGRSSIRLSGPGDEIWGVLSWADKDGVNRKVLVKLVQDPGDATKADVVVEQSVKFDRGGFLRGHIGIPPQGDHAAHGGIYGSFPLLQLEWLVQPRRPQNKPPASLPKHGSHTRNGTGGRDSQAGWVYFCKAPPGSDMLVVYRRRGSVEEFVGIGGCR